MADDRKSDLERGWDWLKSSGVVTGSAVQNEPAPAQTSSPLVDSPLNTPNMPSTALPESIPMPQPAPQVQETPITAPIAPSTSPSMPINNQMIDVSKQTQTTSTPGFKPSEAWSTEQKALDTASVALAEKKLKLDQQKADAEIKFQKDQAEKIQTDIKFDETQANARKEEWGNYQTAHKEAMAEIDNYKINPRRIFADSTFRSIGAAIAAGIGAYASALTGQPNFALNIIDKAIDRDIDAQKEELQTKKGKVGELRSAYSDNLMRFKSEDMATLATRLQAEKVVEANYRSKLAALGKSEAEINQDANLIAIRAGTQSKELQLEQMAQDKVSKVVNTTQQLVTQGGLTKEDKDNAMNFQKRYSEDVKPYKQLASDSRDMKRLIDSARRGDPEAANQLNYVIARQFSGPGVLTDNDLKNASVNRSMYESIAGKVNKGLYGNLTSEELEAYSRLSKRMEKKAHEEMGRIVNEYTATARDWNIPAKLVVGSEGLNAGKTQKSQDDILSKSKGLKK